MNEPKAPTFLNYLLPSILILLGLRRLYHHGMDAASIIPMVLGAFGLYMAIFNHGLLRKVEAMIIKIWQPIAEAITIILLTITFYLVFAPIGLILRLLKKDILNRRFDTTPQSYWIERTEKQSNLKQQF